MTTKTRKPIDWTPDHPNTSGWKDRHLAAIRGAQNDHEIAIVRMLQGWLWYAEKHENRFGSGIGDDSALGPSWAAMGGAIRALLNGETGRIDCGTIDSIVADTLEAEGFDADDYC